MDWYPFISTQNTACEIYRWDSGHFAASNCGSIMGYRKEFMIIDEICKNEKGFLCGVTESL